MPDFRTNGYCVKTDTRRIDVSQVLIYVIELSDRMAEETGVDLVSAAGAGIDSVGVVKVVRKLGMNGSAYIKTSASTGKSYLILKGNPGQRATLTGTRYLTTNPKVVDLVISPKTLARGAAKMTALAVVAYAALRVVEELLRDPNDRNMTRLLGTIASDVTKFALAASAGYLAAIAVGSITTVVAGPLIAGIFVGIATSVVLDRIDREFGLTDKLVRTLEKAADKATSPLEWLAKEIGRWERHIINKAINGTYSRMGR